ncbi:telomerase-binding protein EST1A isoform X2 [Harmonia axyridis]|uniref:telomerase-binding protein EST1A isoform X2 n=1 Tax=Harmonia axyridis TaxID=115357 RepID=UPI001E277AFC|nr:telomerase-binding protein EST1A isoform X2 [Harmonia axyridis]XP_045475194.1 telomerase-binding protein EST1A isoform X2 [Harmonia axyridis]
MKRRPHQKLYTPGSGSLRKSNYGIEESESDTNLVVNSKENRNQTYVDTKFKSEGNTPRNALHNTDNMMDKFSDLSIKDNSKRSRKPDMEIYIPRIVAQNKKPDQENGASRSRKRDDYSQEKEIIGDNERNSFSHSNGNDKRFEPHFNDRFNSNKSKRYSNNRRRGSEQREFNDEWGERNNHSRQVRQGSEPRNTDNLSRDQSNWPRTRDTRSMEHSGPPSSSSNYGDKPFPSKPPSGRRNSIMSHEKMNELPPRFRKKMMEEGKLKNVNLQEEGWDGSSLTFQNTSSQHSSYASDNNYQSGPGSYATLPNSHNVQHNHMSGQNYGFSTLPSKSSRGRGRFNYEQLDYGSVGRPVDLRSPCHSRPSTPQSISGNYRDDAFGGPTSRPHTPSYNRRNDYNRNNEDHYHPSSRQSSQERNRRTNFKDNYRQSDDYYQPRRNDDRYNMRSKDDSYQQNRSETRNNRRRNEHRDRRGRGDFRRDDYRGPNSHDDRYNNDAVVSRDVSPERNAVSLPWEEVPTFERPSKPATPKPVEKTSATPEKDGGIVFDWSEDVEKSSMLEQEALSDVPSRSSSVISLVDNSANQVSSQTNGNSLRKSKRSRSNMRDRSKERPNESESFDNFKVPSEPARRRPSRDSSFERFSRGSKIRSREGSFDRMRKSSTSECENWREEIRVRQEQEKEKDIKRNRNNSGTSDFQRSRQNSEDTQTKRRSCDLSDIDVKKAGVLVIPPEHSQDAVTSSSPPSLNHPRYANASKQNVPHTRSLFDPNNPDKPIIVKSSTSRVAPGIPENKEIIPPPAVYDMFGNICPAWYMEDSEENQMSHYREMIKDVKRADQEIQYAIHSGIFLKNWSAVETFRQFLKESLQYFLGKDLKFSQTCNIEQHFWKLLYYNIIERIRKASQEDEENKEDYKQFVLYLVDEGTQYFEGLLKFLEETYQFQLSDFLGANQAIPQKGLGYIGLALISAQKILIFLGDLARYKEQINETMNFGKCRQWYIKAHEINPKNGRPYKQLAHLAVCARRKLDAVYYYVRSLMSSNPIYSSREKLTNLFYENSRKYEQGEKKRREEKLERARQYMKEKESDHNSKPKSLRKETWIRPDGGQRVHRTTQAVQKEDSEEENLLLLSSVEVNKRFVISYLHVHGKLITKIGMDSFQDAALQMLKEFRALLQHSPLPLPTNRLLQLLALNMFAIESNQLKDPEQRLSGYRSEFQECALVVSLQMFNLILERCVSLLDEHLASKPEKLNEVSMDTHVLLPPIKIWCDWMLCHSSVWNPPPSTQDYRVGAPVDPWTRLAMLINLLRQLDQTASSVFSNEQLEGYELLRLPEDNVLSGFTPLMLKVDEPTYVPKNYDLESGQFVLRLNKLLFFGTEFLCGLEPPVLKLEIDNDFTEYISVVSNANSRDSPQSVEEMNDQEVLVESYSDNESKISSIGEDTSSEVRDLLTRKVELEKWHKRHQLHMERVEKILAQSIISVHIEVLPKYLVPDTNCFIDYLDEIETIIKVPNAPYTIMVPIVVLAELEGLGRGGISPASGTLSKNDPEHIRKVGEAARKALVLLKKRHHNIKCVTTKGAFLNTTTFTTEEDASTNSAKNDDKILTTCLNLSKSHMKEMESKEGEPRQIYREVVLLTDDRNLRVKAHSTDVPVRELSDFMKWAGLG